MTRQTLLAVLALGAMFALGAGTGSVVGYQYGVARPSGDGRRARAVRELERELGLSAAQREQVEAVFARHEDEKRRRLRQTFASCGDSVRAHKAIVDGEIRALLTDVQRLTFDRWLAEQDRRWFGVASALPSGTPPR